MLYPILQNLKEKRVNDMEDIVGIKIKDKIFGQVSFITWGRIFHPVDPQLLLDNVIRHTPKFGIKNVEAIDLCDTLQEISSFPYFYEALFEFSQKIIPDGKRYNVWKNKMKRAIERGEEIYFLGLTDKQKAMAIENLGGTISHGFCYV